LEGTHLLSLGLSSQEDENIYLKLAMVLSGEGKSYLLEVTGIELLVISRTFPGSGTGVRSTATKKRFCAYDKLTRLARAKNAQRFEIWNNMSIGESSGTAVSSCSKLNSQAFQNSYLSSLAFKS